MDVTLSTRIPYSYAVLDNVFPLEKITELLQCLSENQKWFLHKESFFEIYELNLDTVETKIPELANYAWLKENEIIAQLKSFIEYHFNVILDGKCSICVNKLIAGQSIGVHNDAPGIGIATHRFVVNLSTNYQDTDGGHFYVLKANGKKAEIEKMIRPILNTGFAFESSPQSYHAVGKVKEGNRFTLVFTFWHLGNKFVLKEELGNKINKLKEIEIKNPSTLLSQCLEESKKNGLENIEYYNSNLLNYALDTYVILKDWGMNEDICLTGFLRFFQSFDNKPIVDKSIISLTKYIDDFINFIPDSLDSQPRLIQTLYFAHILAIKRISYFSSENWETEHLFLKGIKDNLPEKAQTLYQLIYE